LIKRYFIGILLLCKTTIINQDNVDAILNALPKEREIDDLSRLYKTLADPTRVRILLSLSRQELCVCDLAAILNMTVSAISHQLRLLKDSRLVKYRRDGKMALYSLDDPHVENMINDSLGHLKEVR